MIPLVLAIAVTAAVADAPVVRCLQAHAALHAGAVAAGADFSPASCPEAKLAPAFRHDVARGGSIVLRPIAEGEIIRAYPDYGVPMVQAGEKLRLLLAAGAARIEREVEALQAARPGQRLFVRTGDGQILSVRYEAAP